MAPHLRSSKDRIDLEPDFAIAPQKLEYLNQIVHGDALEIMQRIPSESIDLVITSPPYNLKNSTGNGMKDGRGGKWANAALQTGIVTMTIVCRIKNICSGNETACRKCYE